MAKPEQFHAKCSNVINEEFGKHSYTDSLSSETKPPYNNLQNIT